jgi:protein-S-isoprenylcysteine O-methyltransferase Ste14
MSLSVVWQILYWVWLGSEIAILFGTRTRSGDGDVRDRGSLRLLWVVIFVSITVGVWFGETHPHTIFGGSQWVRSVSVALLALGLAIRWTAVFTLGRSFSANVAIHATQTVHKEGLFRLVRHPSYSGLLIIFVAVALHTRNWVGFAVILVPTAVALMYRIQVEEAALREAFGEEYEAYCKSTKRLMPGVF